MLTLANVGECLFPGYPSGYSTPQFLGCKSPAYGSAPIFQPKGIPQASFFLNQFIVGVEFLDKFSYTAVHSKPPKSRFNIWCPGIIVPHLPKLHYKASIKELQ